MGCCFSSPSNYSHDEPSQGQQQQKNQQQKSNTTQSNSNTQLKTQTSSSSNDHSEQEQQPQIKKQLTITTSDVVTEISNNIFDDYDFFDKNLGQGSFGTVKKAIHKKTSLERAIKIITKKKFNQEQLKSLIKEIDILKSLVHPNILKVYEYYQDNDNLYIVSELCKGQELFDALSEASSYSEKDAAKIFKQILSAVAYCHKNNVVHRDLKPENLLFDSNEPNANLKVIDFGTSVIIDKNKMMNEFVGSIFYIAPEIFTSVHNSKCDIWSCGIILYILLCGLPPFYGDNDMETAQMIVRSKSIPFPAEDWDQISQDAKDFILRMLQKRPEDRPTALELLEDKWITQNTGLTVSQLSSNQPIKAMKNLQSFKIQTQLAKLTWQFISIKLVNKTDEQELIRQFKILDTNGDGVLSRQELLDGYTKVYGETQNKEKEVDDLIRQIDNDDNGEIDIQEFVTAALNKQSFLTQEKIDNVFNLFDKDGNGQITMDELIEVFGTKRSTQTIEQWKQIIQEVDQDGDGQINREEFRDMMDQFLKINQNNAQNIENIDFTE